jgi:hypothetical protein
VEVTNIAKDATDEAAREGLAQIAEETRVPHEQPERSSGNPSDPTRTDAGKAPVDVDAPTPDNPPAALSLRIPSSSLALITSQREAGAPSSSGTAGLTFDEEIAQILLPLTQRTDGATDAADNAEDLAFI